MPGADGRTIEGDDSTTLEDAVDDRGSEVLVVKHGSPRRGRLVGREDHRAALEVPSVDDVEEDIGRIGSVGQVTDFVDDE